MTNYEKELMSRIVNKELFHGCLSPNIGLYSGKMGFSIFLYYYSRLTENKLFADFAGELIDEIYESVYDGMPLSFSNGLCGIGWGLEYLAKNYFIEIDDSSVFDEINYKILEMNPENIKDCSLATGLEGISTYVHAHISAKRQGESCFQSAFIHSLDKRCSAKADNMVWNEIVQKVGINSLTWQNGVRILLNYT